MHARPIQLRPDSLRPTIFGQLGDSLRQLVWAILYAELHRERYNRIVVRDAAFEKHFGEFLVPRSALAANESFPRPALCIHPRWVVLDLLPARPQPAARSPKFSCTESLAHPKYEKGTSFNYDAKRYSCRYVHPFDWEQVLALYVRPHLRRPPPPAHPSEPRELVVHLRSGDVMSLDRRKEGGFDIGLELSQPPCAMYERILAAGDGGRPFASVRVVTEPQPEGKQFRYNPCIGPLARAAAAANVSVSVQHQSLLRDAAVLLGARHLVLAQSLLSITLTQLGARAETVHYLREDNLERLYPLGIAQDVAHSGRRRQCIEYRAPGVGDVSREHRGEVRRGWMRSFPPSALSSQRVGCSVAPS